MNRSFLITIIMALALQSASSYTITPKITYQGASFFSQFNFETADDPTHGFVNYVNQTVATSQKLISVNSDGSVRIGTDTTNVATGRGRNSVRLSSQAIFNAGSLIIADIVHMPTGCGTWPAFWTVGPNWPNSGEIDIIEGVNNANADASTLHTSDGCSMNTSLAGQFTGSWGGDMYGGKSSNCYVNAPNQWGNAGCGITGATGSYGAPFNTQKGGVYATLWTSSEISVYFFPRASIPTDIKLKCPDPTKWGNPVAKFQLGPGSNCPSSHFANHQIVINLTFCGDWAGSVFASNCPSITQSCIDYVSKNPAVFQEAYWLFNSITVYNVA